MTINSPSVTRFFRLQGVCIVISVFVGAIFWANGQPINPLTVILYSLCIGNLVTPSMNGLRFLYAGHLYPILVSCGSVRRLGQGSAVLGVFPAWKYEDSIASNLAPRKSREP